MPSFDDAATMAAIDFRHTNLFPMLMLFLPRRPVCYYASVLPLCRHAGAFTLIFRRLDAAFVIRAFDVIFCHAAIMLSADYRCHATPPCRLL